MPRSSVRWSPRSALKHTHTRDTVAACTALPPRTPQPPSPRWDRRTMSQSRHWTSLGVTGCRKEIAKDRKNVARMSRDVTRMSRFRGVARKIVRVHNITQDERQQSRRLIRSTLRHYNRIPPDWGVASVRRDMPLTHCAGALLTRSLQQGSEMLRSAQTWTIAASRVQRPRAAAGHPPRRAQRLQAALGMGETYILWRATGTEWYSDTELFARAARFWAAVNDGDRRRGVGASCRTVCKSARTERK